jgi:phosphonatase-like hydrolase
MAIALVVFDMAGTTVHDDDAVNVCLRKALQDSDVNVDREMVNAVMGEPKTVAVAKLLTASRGHPVRSDDAAVMTIYGAFERLMLDYYQHDPTVRAADGAVAAFQALKQHHVAVALDTGFHRAVADVILRRLGWHTSDLIDVTVASDEVKRGRPSPDLIHKAMALTGVTSPFEVAKVGDTPADLREGTAAGCQLVIGVTTGSHTREALAAYPHTHLVDHLASVPPLCFEA